MNFLLKSSTFDSFLPYICIELCKMNSALLHTIQALEELIALGWNFEPKAQFYRIHEIHLVVSICKHMSKV